MVYTINEMAKAKMRPKKKSAARNFPLKINYAKKTESCPPYNTDYDKKNHVWCNFASFTFNAIFFSRFVHSALLLLSFHISIIIKY